MPGPGQAIATGVVSLRMAVCPLLFAVLVDFAAGCGAGFEAGSTCQLLDCPGDALLQVISWLGPAGSNANQLVICGRELIRPAGAGIVLAIVTDSGTHCKNSGCAPIQLPSGWRLWKIREASSRVKPDPALAALAVTGRLLS